LLMEMALSKSALHRRERNVLWTICSELDIGRVELAQLEAMLRAQRGFRKSAAGSADAARLAQAYEVLGVNGSSTNAEIKQAYRRLMNRNHPDKLGGSGDAAALLAAQRRTREIRSAWDMLKTRRSIR
jgi:DnaJ like chaperone protein